MTSKLIRAKIAAYKKSEVVMKKFKVALQAFYALLGVTLVLFLIQKALPTLVAVAIAAATGALLTGVTWLYAFGLNSMHRETGTEPANKAMSTSGWIVTSTGLILFLIPPFLESATAYTFFACIFLFASMLAIGIGIRSTLDLKVAQPR